jgi:phosphoribosylanthranilate isomerase
VVQVKICGINRMTDAEKAVELGADALGFVFAKSPRQITPQKVRDITRRISPFVITVGVFVNKQPAKIREIIDFCGLDLVQLHGNESVTVCSELAPRVIKAFRVQGEESLLQIADFKNHVRAILLDAYQEGLNGGTGKTFDWRLALKAKKTSIPLVLSGGLGFDNIEEALERVNPFAIDISSGIEKRPGIKDHGRMRILMDKIKDYERKGTAHRALTIPPEE